MSSPGSQAFGSCEEAHIICNVALMHLWEGNFTCQLGQAPALTYSIEHNPDAAVEVFCQRTVYFHDPEPQNGTLL
jgi:hypothetical protein